MSAFLPTILLVLLGDAGGNLSQLQRASHRMMLATFAGLLVGAAAAGSGLIAGQLVPDARLLMIAIALILAGFTRLVRPTTNTNATGTRAIVNAALLLWRSTAPFTAFAMAIWLSDPLGAGAGALMGLGLSVATPRLPLWILRCAGAVLILLGIIAGLNGLRLI
jgi:Ca2+/H+ antiporter, TMEM165/GDT1 family